VYLLIKEKLKEIHMRLQKLNMKPFLVFLKIVELLSVQDL